MIGAKKINIFYILIAVVFISALLIRLLGLYPGYPAIHPDEGMSYSTAIHMYYNNLKPNRFDYPAGVPLLHLIIYKVFILPIVYFKLFFPHPKVFLTAIKLNKQFFREFIEVIFGYREINAMYWSRYIAAIVGTLTVVLTYFVSKKLFDKTAGIVAAFFLAFNYRHVLGSHFGLPDVHNSFFSLLSFYAALLLWEKNTRRRYLLCGLLAGISFSIKYQIFAFIPFIFTHLFWAIRLKSVRYLFRKSFITSLILSVIVFFSINPYFLFNIQKVVWQNSYTSSRYQMGIIKFRLYPYIYLYNWGIGKLPSIVIILGMLAMFFKSYRKFLLIMAFVAPFMFIITIFSNGGIYPRNFVTVIPFVIIFAGYLFSLLFKILRKINFNSALITIVLAVVIVNFSSLYNSAVLSYFYAKPWNSTKLEKWLAKHLPNGVKIRSYNLYLQHSGQEILDRKKTNIKRWDFSKGPNSLAEFQEEGTNFAIIELSVFQSITYWWRQWPNSRLVNIREIPFDYIRNGYFGLAVDELSKYTVGEIYKPWQAAEENGYLIFKIPPKVTYPRNEVKRFTFYNKSQLWGIKGTFGFKPPKYFWDGKEGKSASGSLTFAGSGGVETARLSSKPILIQHGKIYTVYGWVKNDSLSKENKREGFLRLDFYKNKTNALFDKLSSKVALSSRAYINGKWIKVEASSQAPVGVNYLTVSFQRINTSGFPSHLDDIVVYESDGQITEPYKEVPYINSTIPLKDVYYNSFL